MNKLQSLIILFLLFYFGQANSQVPNWAWAERCGGFGVGIFQNDGGEAIATDFLGNSYITGYFHDTATFGANTIISYGAGDIFLAKYDSSGNNIWVQQAGGRSNLWDYGTALILDNFGNIYLSGLYQDTAYFGGDTLINNGNESVFIAKYDTSGNIAWVRKAGKTKLGISTGLAIDGTGNYYLAGNFKDTAYFGTDTIIGLGTNDVFIAKYDSIGNIVWVKRAGGIYDDQCLGFSFDDMSNIYITGKFEVSANFGGLIITGNPSSDIFTAKYDSNGNIIWAQGAGGIYIDYGTSLSHDSMGNCFITGEFNGTASFGAFSLTGAINKQEIFVVKYNTVGNVIWAKRAGGKSDDNAFGIISDSNGNSYITGYFSDTASFGNFTLINSSTDAFIAKFDSSGDVEWAQKAEGIGLGGNDISMDGYGNLYIIGAFHDTVSFGLDTIISNGFSDVFIAKLNSSIFTGLNYAVSSDEEIEVYPNPFVTEITLGLKKIKSKLISITIKNILGQLVLKTEEINMIENSKAILDLSFLSNGIYLLELNFNDNRIVKKIIKR